MELNDFANRTPWLITADKLESMFHHLPATAEESASIFLTVDEEDSSYNLKNGVAIIPIVGPMFKRATFFSRFFGDRSMTGLTKTFLSAVQDPNVKAIVLDIDSPGGTVSGTEAFGDVIYSARGKKPVVAFANGSMCSGAYWVGSGADKIVVESTAAVGSIGVVMVHYDFSEYDKKWGIKRTVLTAGEFKAIGNDAEPLTEKARHIIQDQLDYLYSCFVETVARNRGVSRAEALKMADGKIFIGKQSVENGLADAVGAIEDAIEMALQMSANKTKSLKKEAKKIMDLETLKKDHPELFAQVQADARADADKTITALEGENSALKTENSGLKTENDRLKTENKELGKQVMSLEAESAANELAASRAKAEDLFKGKLAASTIPEKHHARVMRGVEFESFMTDGVFDAKAYEAAVDAEIKDWEADFKESRVLGLGSTQRNAGDDSDLDESEEDALVDEMAGMAGDSSAE